MPKPVKKSAKPAKPAAKATKPTKAAPSPAKAAKAPAKAAKAPAKAAKAPAQAAKPAKAEKPVKAAAPAPSKVKRPTTPRDLARAAIHEKLGAELSAGLGDPKRELVAFGVAIDALMAIEHAEGLPAHASPFEVLVPEFLSEGDTYNPPIEERIEGFDPKRDGDRLHDALSEVVHAYEERVGAG